MANETSDSLGALSPTRLTWQRNSTFPTSADVTSKNEFVKYWKMVTLILYSTIFTTSTIGNGLVCFIVLRRRAMKSVVNYLILNLAVADLVFTCICIPFDIPVQEMDYYWPYGAFMCRVMYPLQTQTLFASVYTLVALSLSRYWAIVHPLRQQLKVERVKWVIPLIWVISFIPVCPYIATLRLNTSTLSCEENWKNDTSRKVYTLSLFFLQYVIPLTVISCAHLSIALELKRKPTTRRRSFIRGVQHKEARKVARMLATVTLLFAACVLPNNILWLWLDFGAADKNFPYFWDLLSFGNIVVFSNSALNPVCYTMMNDAYRKEIKKVLLRCLKIE